MSDLRRALEDLMNAPHGAAAMARGDRPDGYAAQPGTGPEGETCGSCRHMARLQYAKVYRKCRKIEHAWTHGAKTDIRARSPACRFWEKPDAP